MIDARPAVLAVDDEPVNRALIKGSLGAICEVLEAGSGAEALEVLSRHPVDLVLLDVMMPQMNGYDVCRRIKEQAREYLPVILVTALGEQEDRNRGLEAGADDFLTKPVDRRELLLRARSFLRLREQERVIRRQLEDVRRLQAAKDDLVSLLVHDLRSPLAGIIAHLNLLEEEVRGQQAEDVQHALRAAGTALSRLEDTLQVRLLEEGRLPVHRQPISLRDLVGETVAAIQAIAHRRNVLVTAEVEQGATASVDPALVRRSIENLLSNAVKYTAAGGDVQVTVRRGKDAVEIGVADRGPGIPDALKGGLFEKFGSVEAVRGGPRKGFGLGLYLVKLVAEGHGGAVAVEDRPGGGSVFHLTLEPA
jgi:two-component system sensor histidine kinase/response regulator